MEDLQVSLMNVNGFGIENMSSIGVVEVVDPEHDLKDPVVELTRPVAARPGKFSRLLHKRKAVRGCQNPVPRNDRPAAEVFARPRRRIIEAESRLPGPIAYARLRAPNDLRPAATFK